MASPCKGLPLLQAHGAIAAQQPPPCHWPRTPCPDVGDSAVKRRLNAMGRFSRPVRHKAGANNARPLDG